MTTMPACVTGVDRARGRWVAATVRVDVGSRARVLQWHVVDRFAELADRTSGTIAIDIPIGLSEAGDRRPDHLARAVLPGWARSRVFVTPPRPVVLAAATLDNEEIQLLCRRLTDRGVSRQALALSAAILDVETGLLARTDLKRRTIEVHPELSFAAMSGTPALAAKKTAVGVAQRFAALTGAWQLDAVAGIESAPEGVPIDDCLDALAAAWSAWRHTISRAHTLPPPPHPVDLHGLRMAITV